MSPTEDTTATRTSAWTQTASGHGSPGPVSAAAGPGAGAAVSVVWHPGDRDHRHRPGPVSSSPCRTVTTPDATPSSRCASRRPARSPSNGDTDRRGHLPDVRTPTATPAPRRRTARTSRAPTSSRSPATTRPQQRDAAVPRPVLRRGAEQGVDRHQRVRQPSPPTSTVDRQRTSRQHGHAQRGALPVLGRPGRRTPTAASTPASPGRRRTASSSSNGATSSSTRRTDQCISFSAALGEDGSIELPLQGHRRASAHQGHQRHGRASRTRRGTDALQYSFDEPALTNGQSLTFIAPAGTAW